MGIWIWSSEERPEPEIKAIGVRVALKTRDWIRDLDLPLTCKATVMPRLGTGRKNVKCSMSTMQLFAICKVSW